MPRPSSNSDVAYLARVFPVLLQVGRVPATATPVQRIVDVRNPPPGLTRAASSAAPPGWPLPFDPSRSTTCNGAISTAPRCCSHYWHRHNRRGCCSWELPQRDAQGSVALAQLLRGCPGALKVHVGQLSNDEAAALARSRLGPRITADAIEIVVNEARGVPLFLEQLAHALDEAGEASAGELSFDAVLRRRLGALEATSRRLLEHIVVGGQPLPQAAIVDAAGVPAEQALRDLAALRSQQWVRSQGVGRDDTIEPFSTIAFVRPFLKRYRRPS